jgi:hypothetical protein
LHSWSTTQGFRVRVLQNCRIGCRVCRVEGAGLRAARLQDWWFRVSGVDGCRGWGLAVQGWNFEVFGSRKLGSAIGDGRIRGFVISSWRFSGMLFRRVGASLWVQGIGRARLERGIDTPSRHTPISSNVLHKLNRPRITCNKSLQQNINIPYCNYWNCYLIWDTIEIKNVGEKKTKWDKYQYVCINATDMNIRKWIVKRLSYCILHVQTSVTRIQYIRSINLKINKIYLKYAFFLVLIKNISWNGMPELIFSKSSVDHKMLRQWRV